MAPLPILKLLALALLAPAPTPASDTPEVAAMTEHPYALTLDVRENAGIIEVALIGLSPHAQPVSYALEVTGRSTSRHRGSTTLAAGRRSVLSTMRTAADETWCVRLVAEEQGRAPYEITRGNCIP